MVEQLLKGLNLSEDIHVPVFVLTLKGVLIEGAHQTHVGIQQ